MKRRQTGMRARRLSVVLPSVLALGLLASACGVRPESVASAPTDSTPTTAPPPAPGTPLLLAQFDRGVGALYADSSTPAWIDPDAVTAPDGSAVFSVRRDGSNRLVRLDLHTGEVTSSWPLSSDLSISAVAPDGRWIALTDHAPGYEQPEPASTEIVVFDPVAGSEAAPLQLTGDLSPEAFSVDGTMIFALDYHGDHYRVKTIAVPYGNSYDTIGRDKQVSAEDMHGAAVRGVMSADRTLLATLYRNPGNAGEPAFIHVLDLQHAWSYCADLPPPFGTGPPGSDVIELEAGDTVAVAATQASRIAEIHIDDVHTPGDSTIPVVLRDGTLPSAIPASGSVSGFLHVIAPIAT